MLPRGGPLPSARGRRGERMGGEGEEKRTAAAPRRFFAERGGNGAPRSAGRRSGIRPLSRRRQSTFPPRRFLQRGARRGGWAGREDAQICKVIKILDKAETKLGEKVR